MKGTARPVRWTYEDYLLTPEDGKRYEIIDGELFVSASPVPRHQIISGNLEWAIFNFIERHRPGVSLHAPIGVVLAEDSVVEPDIIFIRKDRLGIIGEKAILGAPDLIIEILSKSSRKRDRVSKRKLYAARGVREYWIVDPDAEKVEVFVLEGKELQKAAEFTEGEAKSPAVLPGLAIPVREIFG